MKTITIKIATNSQLSTTESIKQTNKQANYTNNQNRNRFINMAIIWRVISCKEERGNGGKRQEVRSIVKRYKIGTCQE